MQEQNQEKLNLKDYKIYERLDLITKNEVSYEYSITRIHEDEDGFQDILVRSKFSNDISDLDKDYDMATIPYNDEDHIILNKYIDSRFPIRKDLFAQEIKRKIYEKEYNEDGKLIKLYNKRQNALQINTFDNNGNILFSLYRDKNFNQCISTYLYDKKGRCVEEKIRNVDGNYIYYNIDDIVKNHHYNDINKTSITYDRKGNEIITQWDDDFKRPLFKIFKLRYEDVIYQTSEFEYKGNTTIIKTKCMNVYKII